VRRGPLIGPDQLVDLLAGQAAAPGDETVEPVPFRLMRGDKRVHIHDRRLLPDTG
jgi:hypothetical protein